MVDASTPMTPCITDWRLYVLCQKEAKTSLPKSSKANLGIGYKSLAENLIHFQMHGCILDIID